MSDHDELARDLFSVYEHAHLWQAEERAQRLWAAGWRKKPERDAIIRKMAEIDEQEAITESWKAMEYMYGPHADAILALMDGPTETGEK